MYVVHPPQSVIKAVVQRIVYGNWYVHGYVWVRREFDTWLLARLDQLIDGCLIDEPKTWKYTKKLVLNREINSILDIGAHIGGYSVVLGRRISGVAVEPMPDTFRILVYNILINQSNIKALNMAVYDGSAPTVKLCRSPCHSGADFISDEGDVEVPQTTLNDLWGIYGPFDLVKVDVEGAEDKIFKSTEIEPKYLIVEVRSCTWPIVRKLISKSYRIVFMEKLIRSKKVFNVFLKKR
ncbi:MAG: hypothetical protein DRN04_19145 [Thermoprotei archaeon]|nr:MAG: hypothetical protein DRN04_19145 [Thermoprotei archaeon]